MQRRCLNCFNLFNLVYGNVNEREICPFCGYMEGSPPKEPYHLYPGTWLHERYIIGTVIGFGGFGITYKAWDNVLETVVAVKEYYPTGLVQRVPGDPRVIVYTGESREQYLSDLDRFLEEAKNMAKFIDNPNIVHVDAYFEENNTAYLIMEYLDGVTLKNYLKYKGGRIDCAEAIHIADAVIDALREMHAGGIIHRDVSPDNIMLCNDGRIKLIDFGAARFSDTDKELTRSIILKPGYAPPEQYQSKSMQGPWTDVYALAATMYRAVTGVRPDESINRVQQDEVKTAKELCPDIPEDISNAIMRGMSIHQEIRFKNVDEFKQAVDGRKKVKEPRKELRTRRIKRAITIGVALVFLTALSIGVFYIYRDRKSEAVLPASDVTIWIAVPDGQTDKGLEAMMDSAVEAFADSQKNVDVSYEFIPEDEYSVRLDTAYENGKMPTIYQSEYASDKVQSSADDLTDVYRYLKEDGIDDCYLLEEYEDSIKESGSIPLSFEAPVAYVKRSSDVKDIDSLVISDYTQISSLKPGQYYVSEKCQDLLLGSFDQLAKAEAFDKARADKWAKYENGEIFKKFTEEDSMLYFYGSTDEYAEVNGQWAGRYKVVNIGTDNIDVRFTNEISIYGEAGKKEKKAASMLISYLLKQGAQEAVFLGTSYLDGADSQLVSLQGLPLNKEAFANYIDTNTELTVLESYTEKLRVE